VSVSAAIWFHQRATTRTENVLIAGSPYFCTAGVQGYGSNSCQYGTVTTHRMWADPAAGGIVVFGMGAAVVLILAARRTRVATSRSD
jgi:hypothetical protein